MRLTYWSELTKELRPKILKRDNYTCQRCGFTVNYITAKLHIHHIDGLGTNNIESNLITICVNCHSKITQKNLKKKSKIIKCPICKYEFFTKKPDNYQCKKCGARFEQV